jgi:transcriptional regulator with XRE-family HTH domain
MIATMETLVTMNFPERVATLRKQHHFTQQQLADAIGVHVTQLRRYEAGTAQPTLDVLRKMAVTLSVSADLLLFDHEERGPDEELRLQFDAIRRMPDDDKRVITSVLDAYIKRHQIESIMQTR